MDEVLKDDRFSHIAKDPRFWQMPKKEKKVKIDKRFQAMFNDKKFQVKYSVDKRGRPIDISSKDNLKRFYDLSDGSDEDESKTEKKSKKKKDKNRNKVNKETIVSAKKETKVNKQLKKSINDNEIDNSKQTKKGKQQSEKQSKDLKQKKKNESNQDIHIDMNENEESDAPEDVVEDRLNSDDNDSDNENVNSDNDSDNDGSDNDDDSDNDSEEDTDSDYYDSDEELDPSRGGAQEEESSSEEEFEFDADDKFDHNWMELEQDIPEVKECSTRLAVCNLDWDRIKASDIFVLFNSFKPPNGYIQSVSIYPSEFGKERMKEEEFEGPKELVERNDNDIAQTSEEILEGDQYHREKLRQYQINRLKYYYAVIVCDSKDTATKIYDECDGKEFETSCTKIDLRFIPDDMVFDDEPKSTCTGVSDYKPNYFANSALGRSQVELTWDDTDHDRLKVTMTKIDPKKIDDLEKDYENYIASSSDEEEAGLPGSSNSDSDNSDTEDKRLEKYRQLIQDIDDKKSKKQEEDVEMEITWEPGLKETTQSLVKQSLESENKVTPWQNYLDKKKEKKKERKKERKQLKEKAMMESGVIPEENVAFSDDEIPEGVDINDPYFKSESKDIKKVKKKKGKKDDLTEEELEKKKQEEAKLALLMMDDEDDSKHFNLEKLVKDAKKKKKKKKKKNLEDDDNKEDDFQVDVEDPRFSALFESHLFNVDPSAPEFKKTKGSEAFVSEKQKRRKKEGYSKSLKRKINSDKESETVTDELQPQTKESISNLVKSVKTKTQKFQEKRKKVS